MSPESKKLHSCMTKAITTPSYDFAGWGAKWALARRSRLVLFDDHLKCGNWHIAYDEIKQAALKKQRGLIVSGYVLMVETAQKVYQFGLNGGSFWKGELPFPVERMK